MRLIIVIVGIVVGALVGILMGSFLSTITTLRNPFFISLLLCMIIGACLGSLIAKLIFGRRSARIPRFKHLPAGCDEFVKLILRNMRYRREVRADVGTELAGHFEDKLKDCKSDQERQEKVQQLIENFGDAKLLGVLLRRAKKRCRPLWRTIVARMTQAIVIIFVCLIFYIVWFFSGKPSVTTDYIAELNRLVQPEAAESMNAAPLYHKAAKMYEDLPKEISALLGKRYYEATEEDKQRIKICLNEHNDVLKLVVEGTKKPYYWRNYEGDPNSRSVLSILLPHLSEIRKLMYSLCWRANLFVDEGMYDKAFEDLKACYRLGQHLKGDKTFIEQLLGMAIEALSASTIRDILNQRQIEATILAQLQQDLEQMISGEDFIMNLKFEKLCMYDEIQRCFTDDRFGGGHLYLPRLQPISGLTGSKAIESYILDRLWMAPIHFLFTHPNKLETKQMADDYYAFGEDMAGKSPAQIRAEGIDVEKETAEMIKKNILLNILAPAFGKVHEISYRNKADTEATLVIIAMSRYRQDVGTYPEKMEALITAGYLKQLPMDPWSDKPLVYKKTDDGFMLYGVGSNFKDDSGEAARGDKGRVKKYADEGDWVFWPVQR
ncbi:MAG: hypothetical protein JXB29_01950 [Sedimentisphaerales bacterium]|nr:hypothetical protein [Sedimentisphaerales bacterium]